MTAPLKPSEAAQEIRNVASGTADDARDARRYRWLRETADLRFDCGAWVIGFENWLAAHGTYPRTPNDEPVSCEPGLVDLAIDAALEGKT